MSPGMRTFMLWAAIILIVCYVANINPAAFAGSVLHALQVAHNFNAGQP